MNETVTQNKSNKKDLIWMSVIYLLGLFIGAIDTGIVTPASLPEMGIIAA